MVQLAVLVTAIALGLKASVWRRAVVILLAVFAVAFAVEGSLAVAEQGWDGWYIYVAVHLATLVVGLVIARFLMNRREHRDTRAGAGAGIA
ncbi:MAG TPA: hypothetical protein VM388_05935 [Acidimicrobiales bacterium]|jgi:Na+/proline symporter|nr:hypothetical protein [Acidimicrobiales bacterium]